MKIIVHRIIIIIIIIIKEEMIIKFNVNYYLFEYMNRFKKMKKDGIT